MPSVISPPAPHDPGPSKLRSFVGGPRGISVRSSVYLRYLVYLLTIVIGSAVSHACFAQTQWWAGGYLMFAAAVTMTVTAAIGTWFYTNHRNEIVEQFKHYTLGIAVLPGTAIAILNWASQGLFQGPAAQSEAFIAAMGSALPIIYFCTVVIPAAVFFKVIAGMRALHRSQLDDEETWNAYGRIDQHHR